MFIGINPAITAQNDGHNFSNPTNRFWSVLHAAGFTDRLLRAQDEHILLHLGYGITTVVERPTNSARDIRAEEFVKARVSFEAKIRRYAPHSIAFLGKPAYFGLLGVRNAAWGRQPVDFAGSITWVLPNPSGRNRAFRFSDLVTAYAELRGSLKPTPFHSE